MEGALPSIISKLRTLLVGEPKLEEGMKTKILLLQDKLQSIHESLKVTSEVPEHQLDIGIKMWVRDVRDLSYDIEDSIDKFMLSATTSDQTTLRGLKKFIFRTFRLSTQPKVCYTFATDTIIKSRLEVLCKQRDKYRIGHVVPKPAKEIDDPQFLDQYKKANTDSIYIGTARDELMKILMERVGVSKQQEKVVSIVGLKGLGKTCLAKAVYGKLKAQFDCWAFVTLSKTPDLKKLLKDMLSQLCKTNTATIIEETLNESQLTNELIEFLQNKRYLIVVDDIWDTTIWKKITCALPDNNFGYKIITTTRDNAVAEQIGIVYKLQPLSLHDSRRLFYPRLFSNDNNGIHLIADLDISYDEILQKCAGVPLAIITIATLLASKGRNKWEMYEVYKSVTAELENSLDLQDLRMILSLSYRNLPSHLKFCLLHLSVFPGDCDIDKDRLVRLWIAEGFIQSEIQGESLFDLGESYYYELKNRFMIQPVYKRWDDEMIEYCHVNDMVLDLIRSKSREEDFVTVFNDIRQTYSSEKRLSIQNSMLDHARYLTSMNMQQVRSVVVFPSAVNLMPALLSFRVLRVLDLQDCHLSQLYILKDLGNLIHMRYLGLRCTHIAQLPEEIGNLQLLQTLDVTGNGISKLPSTIVQLKHLMFLRIDSWTRAPNGIGSLTCLEELSTLCIHDSTDIINELGHLRKLRVLGIDCRTLQNNSFKTYLVEWLHKLQHIRSLSISVFGECDLDNWVAPRHLNRLELTGCWSSKLSSLINPFFLLGLSFLSIELNKLQQEDLEILGRLPALTYLDLEVNHENLGIRRLIIGASAFPCLAQCVLRGSIGPVAFQQGAMPRLESLCFTFPVLKMREISMCDGNFDLGLRNLRSLRNVTVSFLSGGTGEQEEEAEAALRNEIAMHHNHPSLEIH